VIKAWVLQNSWHTNIRCLKNVVLHFLINLQLILVQAHSLTSNSSTIVYESPLELIFGDLWGPTPFVSSCIPYDNLYNI